MWGGRFALGPSEALDALNRSLPVDHRLWPQDVQASKAWVHALRRAAVLTPAEESQLLDGLDRVAERLADGAAVGAPDEDVHTLVERLLYEEIGALAGKLHTGRSRNDQVATDLRLWTLEAMDQIDADLALLGRTLVARAREGVGDLLPGYTHGQRAQPVRWAYVLLAHAWPLRILTEDAAETAWAEASVLLDGMLGTGAKGAPRPPQARMIEKMNASGRPIVAVDGPSGVDLTTGETPGEAIRADLTVTFGALKRGLLLYPGRRLAGRIVVVEIGFPPVGDGGATAAVTTAAWARAQLPPVAPNAHKGTLGNVVVVAGQPGVAGAAALVGFGAARAGAGKVYFLSADENRQILQTLLPEAIFRDRQGDDLEDTLRLADALVVGPGMGTDPHARRLLGRIFEAADAPLLLDADALTLMAVDPGLRAREGSRFLLTPHPGELSRMIGLATGEIVRDPFTALQRAVERFGGTILLKGAPSLVGESGRVTLANTSGHSGIATGGMGDTLAGIAGAFMAVGASPYEAGALALYYSGRAAERAGRGRGLLPSDIAASLPDTLTEDTAPAPELPAIVLDLPPPY